MIIRPILWGTIWFVIGIIGLIAVGVIGGLLSFPKQVVVSFFLLFGAIFFLSLPVAILAEIIRWVKQRRREKKNKK